MNLITSVLSDIPIDAANGVLVSPTVFIVLAEFQNSIHLDNMDLYASIRLNGEISNIVTYTDRLCVVLDTTVSTDLGTQLNAARYNNLWNFDTKVDGVHDTLTTIENKIIHNVSTGNFLQDREDMNLRISRLNLRKSSDILRALIRKSEKTIYAGDPGFAFKAQTWSEALDKQ